MTPGAVVVTRPAMPLPMAGRLTMKAGNDNLRAASFMKAGNDNLSLDQIVAQVQSNVNEGELSTRGEGWFIGQAVLVLGVLFAPAEPVAPVAELAVGLAAIASGLALGAAAVRDLGVINLTPWPKPVIFNELQIEGVYSLCRHPMYTPTTFLGLVWGLALVLPSSSPNPIFSLKLSPSPDPNQVHVPPLGQLRPQPGHTLVREAAAHGGSLYAPLLQSGPRGGLP